MLALATLSMTLATFPSNPSTHHPTLSTSLNGQVDSLRFDSPIRREVPKENGLPETVFLMHSLFFSLGFIYDLYLARACDPTMTHSSTAVAHHRATRPQTT